MTTERKKTPLWVWLVLIFVGAPLTLCTAGVLIAGGAASKAAADAEKETPKIAAAQPAAPPQEPAPSEAKPAPEPVAEPEGPSNSIPGEGTFLVGKDIQPGTYRGTPGSMGMCYWTRLKGLSGELTDIIANDIAQGPTIVTVKATDKAFETKGCAGWNLVE